MNKRLIPYFIATALLGVNLTATAEDIDLFVQPPLPDAGTRPNVLIVLDNTANWNTAFTNEMAALVATFDGLPLDKFNVGMMFFGSPDVGYVRAAIRPMDATNRPLYSAMINNLHRTGDSGNARTLARTFSEVHRYLKGLQTVDSGATLGSPHNVKRDYTGNTAGNAHDDAVHALAGNALDSATDTTYNSPLDPDNCFGTYIIYIGNTVPSGNVVKDNTARNNASGAELATAGGSTTQIALPYTSHQDNFADEWARFLKQNMGVITYTVDVDPTPMPGGHGNGMGNSALIESMATVSGGKYFRVNSSVGGGAEIADALDTIFSEIQAVNSVFASVSLPLSVNTQETYLNQIYVGVFRPDEDGLPRWNGNLKQYKLGLVGDQLLTLDAADASAINPSTGFVTECARSFWTPTTQDSYWTFRPMGGCLTGTPSVNNASNSPDGNIVEKGAQAYMLRSSGSRTMKTCTTAAFACTGGLVNFNTTNVSYGDLGLPNSTAHSALVNWQVGLDVDDERPNLDLTEKRPSIHGDVVHSRPVAINYGTVASPKVVVFYSGNDGVLRAVNGNRSTAFGSVAAGGELWSFVAPEFFPQIKRLRANDEQYKFFGNDDVTALPKPYGLDGAITAYTDVDDTWIYVTARRGGRVVYAFDVTDIDDTPSSPSLLWKKGCPNLTNDTNCSTGFDQIGQTWSAVKLMKTGYSSTLAIMGGGYDPCEDDDSVAPEQASDLGPDPDDCTSSSKGNRIYVLNAETGALLKALPTDRGVAADVVMVTDKATGFAKYAYAVDLGGNVYRISGGGANTPFGSSDPAGWTITKLADLGCGTANATCNNRKFLFAPDVVEANDNSGTYFLLVGSGDREKPLRDYTGAYAVNNYFFMLKDMPADTDWLSDENGNCSADVLCLSSLLDIGLTDGNPDPEDLIDTKGWYLELHDHEQVVTSAITVYGTTTFSTHTPVVPATGSCTSTLGTARVYNIGFMNAGSRNGTDNRFEEVSGGGLPPSPVAGLVLLDGSTEPVPFIIGADPDSPLQGRLPVGTSSGTQPKSLTYWFIEK